MVRGGLGGGDGKDVGRKVRRQELGEVGGVFGAPAKFASFDADAGFEVPSGGSEGRSRKSSLSCRGRLSGVSEADAGPTVRSLKGTLQLRDSFALSTVASVFFLAPWWMMEAEL